MRQSALFTKTRKEAPKDEVSKNAALLIRAGFIHKEMAGVYDFLPFGLRVIKNIEQVIREEMNAIGGQEVELSTLQDPELWKKSGRWSDEAVDIWFKSTLKNGAEVGIANTHEEPLTALLSDYVSSYKDLPLYIYQFQTKFRNEVRAKSGIMRVKEFIMKDLYSFSATEDAFKEFYENCAAAYMKIFERVGIGDRTYRTIAAGGSFTTGFTDEFQTVSDAGEDVIYLDEEKRIAVNKEVYTDETLKKLNLDKGSLVEKKSIEVGNIFPLGTKYAEALGLVFKGEKGKEQVPIMGSYGIGLGRLMGTIVEALSDEKGIVWPRAVAPFSLHLIDLSQGNDTVRTAAEGLYEELASKGIDVLYDDRDVRAGEKFADADLIGIPYRVVVSERTEEAGKYELVLRENGESRMVSKEELIAL